MVQPGLFVVLMVVVGTCPSFAFSRLERSSFVYATYWYRNYLVLCNRVTLQCFRRYPDGISTELRCFEPGLDLRT
ncbi:hypothetical protein F5B18DRAFT_69604 [Nemania serpens]|nr:hypothetical protein F5B18DRAFT_69604 [Nemania serpens]